MPNYAPPDTHPDNMYTLDRILRALSVTLAAFSLETNGTKLMC